MLLRDLQPSRRIRTSAGVLVAGLCFLLPSGCITYWRGASDAHDDIDAGRFTFRAGGYYTEERMEVEHIMKTKYGMFPKGIGAGCAVTDSEENYAFGYFSVMNDAVDGHFGKDFYFRVCDEAREQLKINGPYWSQPRRKPATPAPVTTPGT